MLNEFGQYEPQDPKTGWIFLIITTIIIWTIIIVTLKSI